MKRLSPSRRDALLHASDAMWREAAARKAEAGGSGLIAAIYRTGADTCECRPCRAGRRWVRHIQSLPADLFDAGSP